MEIHPFCIGEMKEVESFQVNKAGITFNIT